MNAADLGRVGVWSAELRLYEVTQAAEAAREVEALGYGAIWMPWRGHDIFDRVRALLAATQKIVVATGVVNTGDELAETTITAHHALTQDFPNRFLLGLGVGHGRARTFDAMNEYLDALDQAAPPVGKADRVLAALGPRMLNLAQERTAGIHTANVTPNHTRQAREVLGAGPLIAPMQAVMVEEDPARARHLARQKLAYYFSLPNYTNNFVREGFTADDLANGGSDRLVDALVGWGSPDAVAERVRHHHDAGADHVCLHVLSNTADSFPLEQWRVLAQTLIAS